MSPFSRRLVDLRRRYGLRQGELAALVGYEQSYLSALEVGSKGPPASEFVERLSAALSITSEEKTQLSDALDASQRKFTISQNAEEEVYWLIKDLREHLPNLPTFQVRLIRDLLRLREPTPKGSCGLAVLHQKEEATM